MNMKQMIDKSDQGNPQKMCSLLILSQDRDEDMVGAIMDPRFIVVMEFCPHQLFKKTFKLACQKECKLIFNATRGT